MDLNLLGSDQTKVVGINPKNLIKLVYKVFIPNVFKQVNVHFQGNLELYHTFLKLPGNGIFLVRVVIVAIVNLGGNKGYPA